MSQRTFKVDRPPMKGDDVKEWQELLKRKFKLWGVDHPLKNDGIYGVGTRDATASVLYGMGMETKLMAQGVTPELRTKVRHARLTPAEKLRYRTTRAVYRRKLAQRYAGKHVARITARVVADSWGYHPPVHDGLDIITPEDAPIYALCDAQVVRADDSGWWGKGARGSAGHPVSDGDGVIVLRCRTDVGPFSKGLNFVYGHAENPTVHVGQIIKAGTRIGRAGFANAPHVHLCVNRRRDAKGVGDHDPRPYYEWAMKHG